MTSHPHLAEHFAPAPLARFTPEWWKKTPLVPADFHQIQAPRNVPPPSRDLSRTVKHCYAIRELFSRALVLRLWADYQIMVSPNGQVQAHCPMRGLSGQQHSQSQFPGMVAGWAHFKLMSPWLLFAEEPVHFYYTHPFYHFPDSARFQVMPGVTEFHWQNHVHANCLFPLRNEPWEMGLRVGDPIAYLVPMEDVTITIKAERVSEKEFDDMNSPSRMAFHHHDFSRQHDITAVVEKQRWWRRLLS